MSSISSKFLQKFRKTRFQGTITFLSNTQYYFVREYSSSHIYICTYSIIVYMQYDHFIVSYFLCTCAGHYVNHSELPEPYKTILQDKKQLVLQHRKITLDEIIAKGVYTCSIYDTCMDYICIYMDAFTFIYVGTVGELYAGTLLDLTGGNLQLPIKVAVRVIDG